ncbi:MAG: NAD-dependent epimerase/dehydratase family protein [Candidatus Omnitrophica bacterium]|nr:NAD-dependent epimerase/dehydratase family protein [Candidatus Omnitrophota bacterium]
MRNPVIEEDLRFIRGARLPWRRFEGKSILISGANGFLPAYMAETILYLNETLLRRKAKVYAMVRDLKRAKKRFGHYAGRPDLVFIVQDVCKPLSIKGGLHYIIHAASHSSPKRFGKDPAGTIAANTVGTRNLLELARAKRSEGFLFFSSAEIYGDIPARKMPIGEDMGGYLDPAAVRSCYAEGKRAGEAMCACWNRQYGVPAKIVRPFHTYGPGMKLDDGRVYADFISDVVHSRDIVIRGNGAARRTFCYLADATAGFFTVLLKGKNGNAYNISDEKGEMSVSELARMLTEIFPEKKLSIKYDRAPGRESYMKSEIARAHPRITRIRKLGWAPRYSPEEGFRRTIGSFLWPTD